jgi:hypothetical protein
VGASKLKIWTAIAVSLFALLLTQPSFYVQSAFAVVSSHSSKHIRTNGHHTKKLRTANKRSSRKHKHVQVGRTVKGRLKHKHAVAKTRYAYPMGLFLYQPPAFDLTPLPEEQADKIRKAFMQGTAGDYPTRSLVRARLMTYYPIRGGVFFRRESIKNIIMHSTEPGRPISAQAVIDGWSHLGRRHPGAHYVIERDGTIYQALDPDLAAVHINIFKTLPGFDNDNSVGIEMNHQGGQEYPSAQVQSAVRLAAYLQSHYHIPDRNVVTHRYAQQGDHTDPVNFNWDNFIAEKTSLQNQALNWRLSQLKAEAVAWHPIEETALGKAKIFKGNKPEIVDLTKPEGQSSLKTQQAAIDNHAGSLVKINEPSLGLTSAPVPFSAAANLVPDTANVPARLVPSAPVNRLVPAATLINNNNVQEFKQFDAADFATSSTNKRQLPLKGPIEMDPNEAADLLNESPAGK